MTRRGRKGGWGGGEGATGIKDWGLRKGESKGDRQRERKISKGNGRERKKTWKGERRKICLREGL